MKQKKIWEDEKNLEINTKTKFWMERHRHQCRFNLGNQLISLKMMKTIELTKSEFWWCNFQSKIELAIACKRFCKQDPSVSLYCNGQLNCWLHQFRGFSLSLEPIV